jgi:hypothetical protein
MGSWISVKALVTIYHPKGTNDTGVFQLVQVPIDCGKAQGGICSLQVGVDPLGWGMAFGTAQTVQNGLPFFTESLHTHLLITRIIIINHSDYSTESPFVKGEEKEI